MNNPLAPVAQAPAVDLAGLYGQKFVVTVDTEEEFDWHGPFTRQQHGTTHVPAINRFQTMCGRHKVQPVYLVDYPIIMDDLASEMLGSYASDGRAAIGLQLHPWVNPPYLEDVSVRNSFACNLPGSLERDKLTHLHTAAVERLNVRPDIYRAGRYGAGPNTASILSDLGIRIDSSVRAGFDYSHDTGPDFSGSRLDPYWLMPGRLIELPVTTVFAGMFGHFGQTLFSRVFESDMARSLLARSSLIERLALTPEGIPLHKAKLAIDIAVSQKLPILNFSFHSPSLAVGHTPYVRTEQELDQFYSWWEEIFAYLSVKGIEPIGISEVANTAFSPHVAAAAA